MKILIVNSFYYPTIFGGAEISVQKLAEGLGRKGHSVHVLCTGLENKKETINNVTIHRLKVNNIHSPIIHKNQKKYKKAIHKALDFYNILNRNNINNLLKKINPDIININNIYGFSPDIWHIFDKLNIPVIQTLRDYYLMCPKVNLLRGTQVCVHPSKACLVYRGIYKKLSHKVKYVTAPSKFTIDLFEKEGYFKDAKKCTIYNAIDFNQDETKALSMERSNKLKDKTSLSYVYLGTLDKHKGIEVLLKAFSEVKDSNIKLNIAGKGSLKELVDEYCGKDKRIKYLGFLDEAKTRELLLASDVLIAPSIWYEPFGRVVIDAYKHAIPVIASKIGGLQEIVDNEKTGLLVEPNNKEQLVEAIRYFSNKENILDMIPNCVNKLKEFSLEKQVEDFETLYNEVLKSDYNTSV